MKSLHGYILLIGAAVMCVSGVAVAQGKFDFGKREYQSKCASCHGITGKGDGALKPYLTKSPTDLSTLAKRNNGVFPSQSVYEYIDGRRSVAIHGPRDMPVWGTEYNVQSGQDWQDWPFNSEDYVRSRINALTDYIYRLQAK